MQKILIALNKIQAQGYSTYVVFQDWLDIMLYSFLQQEAEYMEMVHKYPNERYEKGKRPIDYFAYAMAELMTVMKSTNQDVLGDIYMKLNIEEKRAGQFFTPHHIASLMASMMQVGSGKICDPACGSGRLLIEVAKQLTIEKLCESLFYAQDIDLTCVKMCALNMMFFNLNSFVIQGDTLANEVKSGFKTEYTPWGGVISRLSESEVEALQKQIQSGTKSMPNSQLSMFDGL